MASGSTLSMCPLPSLCLAPSLPQLSLPAPPSPRRNHASSRQGSKDAPAAEPPTHLPLHATSRPGQRKPLPPSPPLPPQVRWWAAHRQPG
ncbi:zinc finger protein Pegasus-like isoform X2 [Scylla paramamosain]|uniref:zinc finger protein Pegasus-like isoform X2 n=1 Tax=Scylla paramamosain TaxID=85552 RepID=UPI0030838B6E